MPRRENSISAADLRLRNAVEMMANVFYLLETLVGSPDDIRTYVKAGRPALDIMIRHVQGGRPSFHDGKEGGTGSDG